MWGIFPTFRLNGVRFAQRAAFFPNRINIWLAQDGIMYGLLSMSWSAGTALALKVVSATDVADAGAQLLERRNPRVGMLLGSVYYVFGFALSAAAVTTPSFLLLVVGVGLFTSTGTIILLLSSISTAQKWYPDYRGIAMGLSCMGFGVGLSSWTILYVLFLGPANGVNTTTLVSVFPNMFALIVPLLALSTLAMLSPPPLYIVRAHMQCHLWAAVPIFL